MTRGERLVLWLLDVSCRAREAVYTIEPTDERHEAWRRAEASYAAHMNLYAGPEPTDPEERSESLCVTCGGLNDAMCNVECFMCQRAESDDESMVSHVFGPESER